MKKMILVVLLLSLRATLANVGDILCDSPFFHSTDALAPRDDLGLLHQSRTVYETDFAPRYWWRPLYWLEGERDLSGQPAYVGALQRDLRRLGYYFWAIGGRFFP